MLFQNEIARLTNYDKYKNYYDGIQPLMLPAKLKNILQSDYGILANYCVGVVDAPVAKLKIKSIQCDNPDVAKFIKTQFKKNRMDSKIANLHRGTLIKGDGFISVWPYFTKDNKPVRYDITIIRPEEIFPFYSSDDERSLEYVVRQWVGWNSELNRPQAYKWIYFPDRIERYISNSNNITVNMPQSMLLNLYNAWTPYDPDGLGTIIKNPYGIIPIIHFRNKAYDCPFGSSSLENVIPIQDAINKTLVDLMRIVDLQAFSQRIITGIDQESIPKDSSGERKLKAGPDENWVFADSEAKVTELRPTDLKGLLDTLDKLIEQVCSVSKTPKMQFNDQKGNASSGFALAKMEAPLIEKCEELQVSFSNGYEDLINLLLVQAQFHGDISFDVIPDIDINWNSLIEISPTDALQEAQRLQFLKTNGVISAQEWARLEGYDPIQIKNIQDEIKKENEENMSNVLGHSFTGE